MHIIVLQMSMNACPAMYVALMQPALIHMVATHVSVILAILEMESSV